MEQLIYFSTWTGETAAGIDPVLADILTVAQARNHELDLTGALLACNGWFVQLLEGPPDNVREVYDSILRDPRHEAVTLVGARTAKERFFAEWSMCGARMGPNEDRIINILGRQEAFSPPGFTFETAMSVLGLVRMIQAPQDLRI